MTRVWKPIDERFSPEEIIELVEECRPYFWWAYSDEFPTAEQLAEQNARDLAKNKAIDSIIQHLKNRLEAY